jgi:hypothetical protein
MFRQGAATIARVSTANARYVNREQSTRREEERREEKRREEKTPRGAVESRSTQFWLLAAFRHDNRLLTYRQSP